MKKLILSLVFVLATGTSFINASTIDNNIFITDLVEKNTIDNKEDSLYSLCNDFLFISDNSMNQPDLFVDDYFSLKCWVVKKWVVMKAREVSDDEELIQELADAVKAICEVANDLGLI